MPWKIISKQIHIIVFWILLNTCRKKRNCHATPKLSFHIFLLTKAFFLKSRSSVPSEEFDFIENWISSINANPLLNFGRRSRYGLSKASKYKQSRLGYSRMDKYQSIPPEVEERRNRHWLNKVGPVLVVIESFGWDYVMKNTENSKDKYYVSDCYLLR